MVRPLLLFSLALAGLPLLVAAGRAAEPAALVRLLESRSCAGCGLADADLVHADLRDADLRGARLARANLGGARLDGARLGGADLSFTSLRGASLRGADLRGARLEGTDLRQADLSGALLDAGALGRSHWQQARGLAPGLLSYTDLHNAGVDAANAGRVDEAEQLFGEAIRLQPEAPVSWLARGLCRSELGRPADAVADLGYAATLLEQGGDGEQARQLRQAAAKLQETPDRPKGGNGLASQLVTGAMGLAQFLLPLASKAFVPLPF
ncbi:MAG: pentapeptide repeat-containing protein [Cyanobacteriota bacterium]|jgi:tetratricopeptide (TPR) repeat protein